MTKICVAILTMMLLLSGCGADSVGDIVYKAEDSVYSVKTIDVDQPPYLELLCDYSNIEIYTWDEKKVKFELTKRIKSENGANDLNNFDIQITKNKDKISLVSKYKGKTESPFARSADVRVFLPKKLQKVSCKLDVGNVKFYDDIRGDIDAEVNMANVEINRVEGKVNLNGEMGDVRILNGFLGEGSSIKRNGGSINIKAKFESTGNYDFETNIGNINLDVMPDSNITVQGMGNIALNDFERETKGGFISVKSKMGKITARKLPL